MSTNDIGASKVTPNDSVVCHPGVLNNNYDVRGSYRLIIVTRKIWILRDPLIVLPWIAQTTVWIAVGACSL